MSMMRWTMRAAAAVFAAGAFAQDPPPARPATAPFDPEQQMGLERPKVDTSQAMVTVHFAHGSDVLQPAARQALDEAAPVLNQGEGPLEIGGHTSGVGDEKANQGLSVRRANAVKHYLMGKGVTGERMSTVGYGESQPADTNDTDVGRRHNRRVEIKRSAG